MTTLNVQTRIGWTADDAATAVLSIRAAAVSGQSLLDEHLEVDGAEVEEVERRPLGARPLRLHAAPGPVSLTYTATVQVEQPASVSDVPLPTLRGLDPGLWTWTLPSRYCPSDVLGPTAEHLFGGAARTGALLEQVRHWVQTNILYAIGTSDVHTAADETMLRRTGVCRDLAHLTATLLRGLDVPARLVGVYAPDLQPPDLHAVVEAHDGRSWRLLDATGMAPVDTLVRTATGRDAADIAWGSTAGPIRLDHLDVAVERV